MSSSLPPEAAFPMQQQHRVSTVSMPPSFFLASPDPHSAQVSQSGRKKNSAPGPQLSPLHSPSATMNHSTGSAQVLCKPYRHAPDSDMVDSFNNVEINNPHDRVSMPPHPVNEPLPPPKPPRRASANPRLMECNNDVVNGSRSNTASPELGGASEEPPPIPLKKKNRKMLRSVVTCMSVLVVYAALVMNASVALIILCFLFHRILVCCSLQCMFQNLMCSIMHAQ